MAMTFLQQQNKLSSLLGDSNSSTDDMFPLADRKLAINRGEIHFARDSKIYRNYETGVIASNQISIPADWVENFMLIVDDKVISNRREISIADWERYHDWAGDEPYFYIWTYSGTKLMKLLGNVDGKTYKLYYYAKPTVALSADGNESVFEDEYREASVYYAASELLSQIGKTQLAADRMAVYSAYVKNAKDDIDKQTINKEYAFPDFGDEGSDESDRQGSGGVC